MLLGAAGERGGGEAHHGVRAAGAAGGGGDHLRLQAAAGAHQDPLPLRRARVPRLPQLTQATSPHWPRPRLTARACRLRLCCWRLCGGPALPLYPLHATAVAG